MSEGGKVRSPEGQAVWALLEEINAMEGELMLIAQEKVPFWNILARRMQQSAKLTLKQIKVSRLMRQGKNSLALSWFWERYGEVSDRTYWDSTKSPAVRPLADDMRKVLE